VNYILTFDEQKMGWLNEAIGEMPHKRAVRFIQAINEQILKSQAEADIKEPARRPAK
jgi:hypothetical protein